MCPIAVVLADVDLPYWTSKVEHIAAFTAIFSNICTAHTQKRLFMNFRCKFRHRRSIPDPDFLIQCKISAILWRFPSYIYSRFVWPTDLESIPHASIATSIIPTKFEVNMTIRCRVTAFLSTDTLRDLVTFDLWPFDLEQLSYMAGHVANTATKFEDPKTIRSWVTSYDVSHWLALKMRTRPLRMSRITWPVSRGSKTITSRAAR